MASIQIRVIVGNEEYTAEIRREETYAQLAGDREYVDRMVDTAVERVKRAYRPIEPAAPSTGDTCVWEFEDGESRRMPHEFDTSSGRCVNCGARANQEEQS